MLGAASAQAAPPPSGQDTASQAVAFPEPDEVEPEPLPRHKGLVLDSSLGVLGFAGDFSEVAPPAPWLHTQLGYEIFKWWMLYGEGELALATTSNAQDPGRARAFPMFGFGAGTRFTVHLTERVAVFAQGGIGALQADVPNGALTVLGYRDAESFGLTMGGRLGVEWYQVNRHLALGIQSGLRTARGFVRRTGGGTSLAWDGALAIRYTF